MAQEMIQKMAQETGKKTSKKPIEEDILNFCLEPKSLKELVFQFGY